MYFFNYRKTCSKYRMQYKDPGSKIKDAECKCEEGFHFENEDQRACVPNKICAKGYGQGLFGKYILLIYDWSSINQLFREVL